MSEKKYPFWRVSPNVIVLGAGASRAAFPNGDKYGRKLPLMKDFIEILNLRELLNENSIPVTSNNIEDIYSELYKSKSNTDLILELNERIVNYFSYLKLPDEVTLYDELLLTLQKKDIIFSFNWDPLILQAYSRNYKIGELPEIWFLHGNVLQGVCEKDKIVGYFGNKCGTCKNEFIRSKLLYPIKEKNYETDELISESWQLLKMYLYNSFMFTIFGYSAPKSDFAAREILLNAWNSNKRKELNEITIVDTSPKNKVEKLWKEFIFQGHRGIYNDIRDTQSFKYTRRSCESWGDAIFNCTPWSENPLPKFTKLQDLQSWVQPLIQEEVLFREKDIILPEFH